tara:strand:+ start:25328 stop:26236 length:909 start_codon:yes stop_codon:yes gene_type:complete
MMRVLHPVRLKRGLFSSLAICLAVILCAPAPSYAQQKTLGIAAFQVLGIKSKVAKILTLTNAAYQKHTGTAPLALSEVTKRLGKYGLVKLKACDPPTVKCLSAKGKTFLKTDLALFLGIGGFGEKILIDFLLVDLSTGKQVKRTNKTFDGFKGMESQLPAVMTALFPPTDAKLVLEGTPKGAAVTLDGKASGELPTTLSLKPGKEYALKISHPKHKPYERSITMKPGKKMTISIALPSLAPVARRPDTRPPERRPAPAGEPVFRKVWFWAVVGGVVVVGAGVAIGVAAASSGPQWPELQAPF